MFLKVLYLNIDIYIYIMGSVINDIDTIKIANNLHNTRMLSLITNLQNNFDSIVLESKKNLIMSIAKDYKLNEKELIDRYINTNKKEDKKEDKSVDKKEDKKEDKLLDKTEDKKEDKKEDSDNLEEKELEKLSTPVVKKRGRIPNALKKTKEVSTENKTKDKANNKLDVKSKNTEEIEVDSDTQKGILKYIKIKNEQYLLDSSTNEIFDINHNKIGRKDGNKCILQRGTI